MISAVSIAIMSSSLVAITAAIGLVLRVMRPRWALPWVSFTCGSSANPANPSSSTIRARTWTAFSPMPPVKTRASTRPSDTIIPAAAFATE